MKMNELMIYQVFPLRALTDGQPSHGILEMIDWIPHIKKLGMNAVYFSPVFSSSDHGYDTKDYQKIDERLGTNEDFKKMCDAMHEEGNIGAFGASNWTHTRIEEANEYAYKHNLIPFSVSSPNFCLARQVEDPWGGGCVNISGPENQEARAWYEKNQMPVAAIVGYTNAGKSTLINTLTNAGVLEEDKLFATLDPTTRVLELSGQQQILVTDTVLSLIHI